jgi:hypothetical protein
MAYKDSGLVPKLHNFDITGQSETISQTNLRNIRNQLNAEYLKRYADTDGNPNNTTPTTNQENSRTRYMDYYQTGSIGNSFTDSDGRHWNRQMATAGANYTNGNGYQIIGSQPRFLPRDNRGTIWWFNGLDRFVKEWNGPPANETWKLGVYSADNPKMLFPTDNRGNPAVGTFKEFIDGLSNIIDIDKYYGMGWRRYDSQERPWGSLISHSYRQLETITDWIPILALEQPTSQHNNPGDMNETSLRRCLDLNDHTLWYITHDFSYRKDYTHSGENMGTYNDNTPSQSFTTSAEQAIGNYTTSNVTTEEQRNEQNPTYMMHMGKYSSCLTACTGICTITCFHVCHEQCVYVCDDSCGYSCQSPGLNPGSFSEGCGTACIADCQDKCGGTQAGKGNRLNIQTAGRGNDTCMNVCSGYDPKGAPNSGPSTTGCNNCSANCDIYVQHQHACVNTQCTHSCQANCDKYCKQKCTEQCGVDRNNDRGGGSSICRYQCQSTCSPTGTNPTCANDCNTSCWDDCQGKCGVDSCVQTCEDSCMKQTQPPPPPAAG